MDEIKYLGHLPTSALERVIVGEEMPSFLRQVFPTQLIFPTGRIGYVDFQLMNNSTWGGEFLYINTIAIEPAYRKQGYGEALLDKLEEIAQERRVPKILTSGVWIDNIRMISLLEKMEYRQYRKKSQIHWRIHQRKYPNHIISVLFEKMMKM